MAVRAGFTAPMLGKTLVSTTYRLSSSCALQFAIDDRHRGVDPHPARAGLVRDAGDGDGRLQVGVAWDQVVRVQPR
jgi:hypothetical protein